MKVKIKNKVKQIICTVIAVLLFGGAIPATAGQLDMSAGVITMSPYMGQRIFQDFEDLNWWEFGLNTSAFVMDGWSLDVNFGWVTYNKIGLTYGASISRHFSVLDDNIQPFIKLGIEGDSIDKSFIDGVNDKKLHVGPSLTLGSKFYGLQDWTPRVDVKYTQIEEKGEFLVSFGLDFKVHPTTERKPKKPIQRQMVRQPVQIVDLDNDGVSDHLDSCPETIPNAIVDGSGCLTSGILPYQFKGRTVYTRPGTRSFNRQFGSKYNELRQVALYLKKYPTIRVTFQLYGSPGQQRLATNRVKAMKRYFLYKFNIPNYRINITTRMDAAQDGLTNMMVNNPSQYPPKKGFAK